MLASLTIARRYRGPRTSANGGYAAGLLAQVVGAPAVEVTLRLPPPLERPLAVTQDGERFLLVDGDALVAEARRGDPAVEAPVPPTFAEAAEAARSAASWGAPEFDECFVCGTRSDGSGLEIHAGRVSGRVDHLVATTWVARDVRPEIAWAVIDCPGAYALRGEGRGEPLLARITARIDRLPTEGEQCVVVGWPLSDDGRKRHAATALYGADGEPLAVSRQLWIEPREGGMEEQAGEGGIEEHIPPSPA
jgi:hypothetical protein